MTNTETLGKGIATDPEFERVISELKQAREEATNFLRYNGIELTFDKWVTAKKYCELFGIEDTQVVTNWIKRGIIPPQNVRVIEELNNLRLIKAVKYK